MPTDDEIGQRTDAVGGVDATTVKWVRAVWDSRRDGHERFRDGTRAGGGAAARARSSPESDDVCESAGKTTRFKTESLRQSESAAGGHRDARDWIAREVGGWRPCARAYLEIRGRSRRAVDVWRQERRAGGGCRSEPRELENGANLRMQLSHWSTQRGSRWRLITHPSRTSRNASVLCLCRVAVRRRLSTRDRTFAKARGP